MFTQRGEGQGQLWDSLSTDSSLSHKPANSAGPKLQPQPSLPFAAWNTSTAVMNSLKEGWHNKRRGCLFLLTSQMLDYSYFLSSCWVFRGFEDLGGAKEMWVIRHLWMNLPCLLPLSAVYMCIELEIFPWRTDNTSKTCCSFHLEASQQAHFKNKLFFSVSSTAGKSFFPP